MPLRGAVLEEHALAFDVPELRHLLTEEHLEQPLRVQVSDWVKKPDAPHLPNLLGLRAWHGQSASQRDQQEAAAVHAGIVERAANHVKCTAQQKRRGLRRPIQPAVARSSSSTRLAILAPQSHVTQTIGPSTPAS